MQKDLCYRVSNVEEIQQSKCRDNDGIGILLGTICYIPTQQVTLLLRELLTQPLSKGIEELVSLYPIIVTLSDPET
jgi:hypothetical protein